MSASASAASVSTMPWNVTPGIARCDALQLAETDDVERHRQRLGRQPEQRVEQHRKALARIAPVADEQESHRCAGRDRGSCSGGRKVEHGTPFGTTGRGRRQNGAAYSAAAAETAIAASNQG